MPSTAVVMRPFLPKPRGHSPDFVSSSASASVAFSASLSESARRRLAPERDPAGDARARRPRGGGAKHGEALRRSASLTRVRARGDTRGARDGDTHRLRARVSTGVGGPASLRRAQNETHTEGARVVPRDPRREALRVSSDSPDSEIFIRTPAFAPIRMNRACQTSQKKRPIPTPRH